MSDYDNQIDDNVDGVRATIVAMAIPDVPEDADRFGPAFTLSWRDRIWLCLPFANFDGTLTLEVIGYIDEDEKLRRVLDL